MFRSLFGKEPPKPSGTMVIARVNDRAQPIERGERYEDPLQEVLSGRGWGEVSGGGTQLSELGEIQFCDVELTLSEATPEILRGIVEALEGFGAPAGSELQVEPPIRFGTVQGLAIYLNGTDLPDEVYRDSDFDFVNSEFDRLLSGIGSVRSFWQGPTETAIYAYGRTADEMRAALQPFLDAYPLCARARVVQIA
ncbi:MAG TPA: hypothetical protein VH740_07460 [Vicinamibacterales bacterium]